MPPGAAAAAGRGHRGWPFLLIGLAAGAVLTGLTLWLLRSPARLLSRARSRATYVDGQLLYVNDGLLLSHPFDADRLDFSGPPVALAEGITQSVEGLWGAALFSVSSERSVLFVRHALDQDPPVEMVWRDREGQQVGTLGEPADINDIRISADGRRVAVSISDPGDIWLYDLDDGHSTRFTFDTGNDVTPCWSPDGDRILFMSSRLLSDGKWMTYQTDETGQDEIYVRAFPPSGGKWQISTAGGRMPVWSGDGDEIFFIDREDRLVSVGVSMDGGFRATAPEPLFTFGSASTSAYYSSYIYDVSPDGERFLLAERVDDPALHEATVTLVRDALSRP